METISLLDIFDDLSEKNYYVVENQLFNEKIYSQKLFSDVIISKNKIKFNYLNLKWKIDYTDGYFSEPFCQLISKEDLEKVKNLGFKIEKKKERDLNFEEIQIIKMLYKKYDYRKYTDDTNFDTKKKKDLVYTVLKKNQYVYKSMSTFIDTEQEEKYLENTINCAPVWYGTETIAKYYSYILGPINAYKLRRNFKLLRIIDKRNYPILISEFEKLTQEDFDQIELSRETALDYLKIKLGISCDLEEQYKLYLSLAKNDIRKIKIKKFLSSNELTLDYIENLNYRWLPLYLEDDVKVGKVICLLSKKLGFDGYYFQQMPVVFEYKNIYFFHNELIFCNCNLTIKNNLIRDISNPVDWTNNKKILSGYEKGMRPSLGNYEKKIDFYYKNMSYKKELNQIKGRNFKIKFMTFNVHFFESINTEISMEEFSHKIIKMMDDFDLDFICLQEYTDNPYLENMGLHVYKKKANWIIYNAVISRKPLKTFGFYISKTRRSVIFFKYNGLFFCNTHLEIGSSLDFYLSNKDYQALVDTYYQNSDERIEELQKIINVRPNVIMGDLNFNKEDPEYDFITQKYRDTIIKEKGSLMINKSRVDYIFALPRFKVSSMVIPFNLSDHLPVLGLVSH